MAGLLFFEALVHDFALLARGQHALEGGVDAAFRGAERERTFIAAFGERALVFVGLGGRGCGATGGQLHAEFLKSGVEPVLRGLQPFERLLAREQRLRIQFQRLLFLPLADRAHRFQGKTKFFHAALRGFPSGGRSRFCGLFARRGRIRRPLFLLLVAEALLFVPQPLNLVPQALLLFHQIVFIDTLRHLLLPLQKLLD